MSPTPPAIRPTLAEVLDKLVRGFPDDIQAAGRAIREIFKQDSESFCQAVLPILRKADSSQGFRYLAAVLVSNGLMPSILCGPGLSEKEAVAAARMAMRIDPMLDVLLARRAAEAAERGGPESTERLLAILDATCDGNRIMPSLMMLARHPDPRVRSKATLLIGRSTHNPRWVERVLSESDARVRANAVEAIWGVDTAEVRAVLAVAATDANNRVAGNALLALYRLGDTSAIPALVSMARRPEPGHRATAAWVIGESEDGRFSQILARLMADPDPMVRHRAHHSLVRLRATLARTGLAEGAALVVGPPRHAGEGWRAASVALKKQRDPGLAQVKPTCFHPYSGDCPLWEYQVEALTPPPALAMALLLPAGGKGPDPAWMEAIRGCLAAKRSSDLWAVARYREAPHRDAEAQPQSGPPMRYSASSSALEEQLEEPPDQPDIVPEFVLREAGVLERSALGGRLRLRRGPRRSPPADFQPGGTGRPAQTGRAGQFVPGAADQGACRFPGRFGSARRTLPGDRRFLPPPSSR